MTHSTKYPRRAALPAAALAALLLAGCSSGNVGESWQCPLADAGTCDSVAAADPAVPDMDAARNAVLGEPLWRVRGGAGAAPPKADSACEADCVGFDPFGWLARLFAAETASDAGSRHGKEAGSGERNSPPVRAAALSSSPPQDRTVRPADPAAAPLPAEPDPALEEPAAGDLRTDEVVARIWIAPFVDADGVYREASHVRVVLEPAGWRLGR